MGTLSKGQVGFGANQQWAILMDPPIIPNGNIASKSESGYGALPAGVVGFGANQDWAILYSKNPATGYDPSKIWDSRSQRDSNSNYLSKGVVGAGAGQDWALMYDRGGLVPKTGQESGFKINLPPAFRRAFCRKYVKSLGYLRREGIGGDKVAYIQAINDCLVHFSDIKKGKYKMKPADNMGSATNIDAILSESEQETGLSKNDPSLNNMNPPSSDEMESSRMGGSNNMMMYALIALAVIAIIFLVIYFRRKNAKNAAG